MANIQADASQFERGQVISAPSSLPGCVQLARLRNTRSNTKRLVVVKRYSLAELTREDEEVTGHIQHEVAAMKQFEHPNILRMFGACFGDAPPEWPDGLRPPCILCELMSEGTLLAGLAQHTSHAGMVRVGTRLVQEWTTTLCR